MSKRYNRVNVLNILEFLLLYFVLFYWTFLRRKQNARKVNVLKHQTAEDTSTYLSLQLDIMQANFSGVPSF